jgi:hypothetical protein
MRTGWALGPVDGEPQCGSVQLASKGASAGAIGAGLMRWLGKQLAENRPDVLVYEAPMPFGAKLGKRNAHTDRTLSGLCFLAHTIAFCRGVFDVREASTPAVRQHFIGANCVRQEAKFHTVRKCRALGWLETADDDAADACALWSFQCSMIDPIAGIKVSPLFNRAAQL